jgi:putative SOS response-associated peptidase YedK
MCFIIEIHRTRTELESRFNRGFEQNSEEFEPKYYISAFEFPKVPVIMQEKPANICLMNWGLVPAWLKDSSRANDFKHSTLNAKAETLEEKPSFKVPLINKRCLIISHGFFEWQHNGREKIPFYIKMKNDAIFTFAGLYDEWVDKQTGEIYTGFSIITCEANSMMAQIHNSKKRMPVIIEKDMEESWIESGMNENKIALVLKPLDNDKLIAWPIGNLINNRNQNRNVPGLIEKKENENS